MLSALVLPTAVSKVFAGSSMNMCYTVIPVLLIKMHIYQDFVMSKMLQLNNMTHTWLEIEKEGRDKHAPND